MEDGNSRKITSHPIIFWLIYFTIETRLEEKKGRKQQKNLI